MIALVILMLAGVSGPAGQAAGPQDVPVAVLAHAIERGARIERGDLVIEPRPAGAARGALAAEEAAGMEAARRLTAGSVVRAGDVLRPQLVRRGEQVTIRVVSGPLVITTAGRALTGGAAGETVRVVADSTSRTLDATVEGSGTVRITTP